MRDLMANFTGSTGIAHVSHFQAERFDGALQNIAIGRAGLFDGPAWRAVFIEQGRAELDLITTRMNLTGPCLIWVPWVPDYRLRIFAGASGSHILLNLHAIESAVGRGEESEELRALADRTNQLALHDNDRMRGIAQECFDGILHEAHSDAASSFAVIEARLRILLICLWRDLGQPESMAAPSAQGQRIIRDFRNVVEQHFRERCKVKDCAAAIGVSRDRLNDVCQRQLDKSPSTIINERICIEARQLLESSPLTIEQVSGRLGFQSAAQFNRFFKVQTGMPPGRYRSNMLRRNRGPQVSAAQTLYDWP